MDPTSLLNCRRLPGRLTAEQAAALIGCCPHDIAILTRANLIKPLGDPAPNAVKYFSSAELEKKLANDNWTARVTNALYRYWQDQKRKRKTRE